MKLRHEKDVIKRQEKDRLRAERFSKARQFILSMNLKTCIEITEGLDTPVKLEQRASGLFRVTYGKQVRDRLTYADACKEFGGCVFHSLACNGSLSTEGP